MASLLERFNSESQALQLWSAFGFYLTTLFFSQSILPKPSPSSSSIQPPFSGRSPGPYLPSNHSKTITNSHPTSSELATFNTRFTIPPPQDVQPTFPLLNLPLEIRHLVYRLHLLDDSLPFVRSRKRLSSGLGLWPIIDLIMTNHQLHDEVLVCVCTECCVSVESICFVF